MTLYDAVKTLHREGRFDSERYDAPNCKPGNKPCGKTCIPQRYQCKGSGGGNPGQISPRKALIRKRRVGAAKILAAGGIAYAGLNNPWVQNAVGGAMGRSLGLLPKNGDWDGRHAERDAKLARKSKNSKGNEDKKKSKPKNPNLYDGEDLDIRDPLEGT